MRILAEQEVPSAIRLREIAKKPEIESREAVQLREIQVILRTIAERLQTPPVVDLAPVVAALTHAAPPPSVVPPKPSGGWTFAIERDEDGLIAHVRATRTS